MPRFLFQSDRSLGFLCKTLQKPKTVLSLVQAYRWDLQPVRIAKSPVHQEKKIATCQSVKDRPVFIMDDGFQMQNLFHREWWPLHQLLPLRVQDVDQAFDPSRCPHGSCTVKPKVMICEIDWHQQWPRKRGCFVVARFQVIVHLILMKRHARFTSILVKTDVLQQWARPVVQCSCSLCSQSIGNAFQQTSTGKLHDFALNFQPSYLPRPNLMQDDGRPLLVGCFPLPGQLFRPQPVVDAACNSETCHSECRVGCNLVQRRLTLRSKRHWRDCRLDHIRKNCSHTFASLPWCSHCSVPGHGESCCLVARPDVCKVYVISITVKTVRTVISHCRHRERKKVQCYGLPLSASAGVGVNQAKGGSGTLAGCSAASCAVPKSRTSSNVAKQADRKQRMVWESQNCRNSALPLSTPNKVSSTGLLKTWSYRSKSCSDRTSMFIYQRRQQKPKEAANPPKKESDESKAKNSFNAKRRSPRGTAWLLTPGFNCSSSTDYGTAPVWNKTVLCYLCYHSTCSHPPSSLEM